MVAHRQQYATAYLTAVMSGVLMVAMVSRVSLEVMAEGPAGAAVVVFQSDIVAIRFLSTVPSPIAGLAAATLVMVVMAKTVLGVAVEEAGAKLTGYTAAMVEQYIVILKVHPNLSIALSQTTRVTVVAVALVARLIILHTL